VPKSTVNRLNYQIDDSQHDIESIESYICKQDNAFIWTEEFGFLRGLQDMYQQRIVTWQAEVSACKTL
jgi:hypothetical protein